ncbi:MAG: hypothetical protein KIC60_05335 [Clostridium sp.]|nr:hypothetical protein [Clostridium sp.]
MEDIKENFFDLLFEKMEDSDAFDMRDEELELCRKEDIKSSDNLYKFINQKVHPKSRRELYRLLEKRTETTSNYYFRENQLYYKNGFLQGMYVMMSMYQNKEK